MNRDFAEFIAALLAADARFLVVGAHALAVHGVVRATGDIDIWIDRTHDNARRVWDALLAFGAPVSAMGVTLTDLSTPEMVVQIGIPPRRIDVLTSLSGLNSFDHAWASRVERETAGLRVPFLGREALIVNKRASGRYKDLGDIEALGESPGLP